MNKNALIIAVIIIIIGGAFFLFANKAEAPDSDLLPKKEDITNQMPASNSEDVVDEVIVEPRSHDDEDSVTNDEPAALEDVVQSVTVVTYTDDGFSPKSVTISQGDIVRFVNESSSRMWVASASHPTHTFYPEKTDGDCLGSAFDQCEAVENSSEWEFVFNKTGTHKYHNHVRASKTGTIIVE